MRHIFAISSLLLLALTLTAQSPSFSISELPSMPEPVANNAVVSAMCGDTLCVYSFCGIDETKTPAGIHLKAWRYNTVTQIWSQLTDVPDDTGNGKIAAGASVVNNKIYLIGGYYVEDDFSEESSDDVHVFNPETNQWEEDGAEIPVPIDDHVQAVWNEELIYIVTGWSDNGNVPDVQIYNPAENTWLEGTATPNTGDYKVFGGSGEILGNRIIYHGGVRSAALGFFPTDEVRVGNINPLDPTDIQWELMGESEQGTTYRAAALAIPAANSVFWIGGSALGYNFNGIDYNGTGGV
ncbi:MAG: Kelch repeat-containing protein, partial [Flavobacteriales bacterium]